MNKLKIKIILASVRQGRFGDKPAKWIYDIAERMEELSPEILDLLDHQLPMFAEVVSPAHTQGEYRLKETNIWAKKIAEADGFIIVTPEYNHGYPASLKNNIDYLYKEWLKKPVGFVSYGSTGGARVIEQLRQVAIELQMAPIRNSVHINAPWNLVEKDGTLKSGGLDPYKDSAENLLTQLIWWARALKNAREE